MSPALVLDAEAIASLAGGRGRRLDQVRAALEAARRLKRDVIVPAVILVELYRSPNRNKALDSWINRDSWVWLRSTDREFARYVGSVLGAAGVGSEMLADAHTVAAAVEAGGGVVLTGDESDIERLAAPYPNVQAVAI
ncbi:MAG: PIN domain-containing protein [Acidimicrobiales bacterium]